MAPTRQRGIPLLRLASKYVSRRRDSSLLLILTLAIMISLLIALFVSSEYINYQYTNLFTAATSPVDLVVTMKDGGFFNQTRASQEIAKLPGVAEVSPRIEIQQPFRLVNGTLLQATLIGLERGLDIELGSYPVFQKVSFSNNYVILSDDLGSHIYTSGHYNSTRLSLIDGSGSLYNVTVSGFVHPQMLQLWMHNIIFIDLSDAQTGTQAQGQVNAILVQLKDFLQSSQIVPQISQELGSSFLIKNMKAGVANQVRSDLDSLISTAEVPLVFSLCFAVTFFVISLFITVRERRGELMVMQTLGATYNQLIALNLFEAIIVGLVGVSAGFLLEKTLPVLIILAAGGGSNSALLGFFMGASDFGGVAAAAAIGLASTIIGFTLPILPLKWHINTKSVAFFLRIPRIVYAIAAIGLLLLVMIHPYQTSDLTILLDAASLVGALLLLAVSSFREMERIVGTTITPFRSLAKLVSLGFKRSLRYHFATLAILALAISLVVLTGGVEASVSKATLSVIERQFGADIVGKPYDPTPANYNLHLLAISGVSAATPLYVSESAIGSNPIAVVAIDPKTFSSVVTLFFEENQSSSAYMRMISSPLTVFVARPLLDAMSNVYARQLQVNSSFPLNLGGANFNVTVGAVISSGFLHWLALDGIPLTQGIFISYELLLHSSLLTPATGQVSLFLLKTTSGVDPQSVALELNVKATHPLEVFTAADIETNAADAFNSLFLGLQLLTYLSALLATLSLVSIAGIDVIDRRFELGLFRALGMTRLQSLQLFIGEFFVTILMGSAIGVVSGVVMLSESIALSAKHIPITAAISLPSLVSSFVVLLLPSVIGGIIVILALSTETPSRSLTTRPLQIGTN